MSTYDVRRPRLEAQNFAVRAKEALTLLNPDLSVWFAGSLRRYADTIGDVDLLVTAKVGARDMEDVKTPEWLKVTEKKAHGWLVGPEQERMMIDAWWCPWDSRGPFALFLTGPMDLNVWMRQKTSEHRPDAMLSQYGVFRRLLVPTPKNPTRVKAGERIDEPDDSLALSDSESEFWEQWCELIGQDYAFPHPQERDSWRRVVGA